jgi:hypothetical protein
MKPIKVIHRKLGREQAHGQAWKDERIIEIDPRLKGLEYLETVIHEITHIQNPQWPEIKVQGHSKQTAEILWDLGFRKTDI